MPSAKFILQLEVDLDTYLADISILVSHEIGSLHHKRCGVAQLLDQNSINLTTIYGARAFVREVMEESFQHKAPGSGVEKPT